MGSLLRAGPELESIEDDMVLSCTSRLVKETVVDVGVVACTRCLDVHKRPERSFCVYPPFSRTREAELSAAGQLLPDLETLAGLFVSSCLRDVEKEARL